MEAQTLPNNTNNSQIFTILRILIGVILLSPIDIEQLFNGVLASNWPVCVQLLIHLSKLTIS
jgi:hypothetical protein